MIRGLCICHTGYIFYNNLTVVDVESGSSRKDVQVLFPEEEKIIVEETRSNGQTVVEERWETKMFFLNVCYNAYIQKTDTAFVIPVGMQLLWQ